jgi:hypothetical protein
MATITLPYTFAAGNLARAAEVNQNFDAILAQVNGALSAVNLANGAVTENKIFDRAVTAQKIALGTITNANISDSANIHPEKIGTGDVTLFNFNHLRNSTSNIQSQLNAKQDVIGFVSNEEIGYLDGVTSSIQTQLNGKEATVTGGATSILSSNLTTLRALISDSDGKVVVSPITSTELGYMAGTTSAVQTQLNGKAGHSGAAANPVLNLVRVTYEGVGIALPAGWTCSRDVVLPGVYYVNHTLGSSFYVAVATCYTNTGPPSAVASVDRNAATITVHTFNPSTLARVDCDFYLMVMLYA